MFLILLHQLSSFIIHNSTFLFILNIILAHIQFIINPVSYECFSFNSTLHRNFLRSSRVKIKMRKRIEPNSIIAPVLKRPNRRRAIPKVSKRRTQFPSCSTRRQINCFKTDAIVFIHNETISFNKMYSRFFLKILHSFTNHLLLFLLFFYSLTTEFFTFSLNFFFLVIFFSFILHGSRRDFSLNKKIAASPS